MLKGKYRLWQLQQEWEKKVAEDFTINVKEDKATFCG